MHRGPACTYYRWKNRGVRKPSELELQIKEICEKYKFCVGYRTVNAWLKRDYNVIVNRNTVQKIMQIYTLQSKV